MHDCPASQHIIIPLCAHGRTLARLIYHDIMRSPVMPHEFVLATCQPAWSHYDCMLCIFVGDAITVIP